MEHDASDILGQNTMPSPSGAGSGLFSLSTTQSIYTAIALGGFLYIGLRLWKRVMVWRERSYKLATRRRHGIPDTDLRPFNVAYSEAVMRAREEENQRHPKSRPAPRPQPSFVDLRESSQEDSVLRNRSGIPQRPDTGMRSTAVPVPGGYYPTPSDPSHLRIGSVINETHPYVDQTGKEINGQFTHAPAHTKKAPGLTRQRGYFNVDDADDSEDKKRSFDDDIDEEHESKKTRVDGDELMDGDDDAEFEEEAPRRGSKRGLREDVDEFLAKAARGKRARKVSAEKPLHPDSSMDVDLEDEEADEVPEMSPVRGKKRDRAEAGSTFGGDDDEEDEQESTKASRRRIKRRTVSKRKSETGVLRGKKRDRAGSAEASEASGSSPDNKRSSRAKRGKRTSNGGSGVHHHHHHHRDQDDRAARSDVSMDESTTSNRSKVRSVGDEWESNGVKYKIGPNYQRLRQALVKKARQKFLMPKDSQHPDRSENLRVCIETWLTEEEYQEAKRQHMLAWQDDSPKSRRPEQGDKLTIDVSQANGSSHQAGKSLLWGRSTTTTPTMSPAPTSPTSEAGAMALDKLQTHALAQTPAKEHRYGRHSLAGSAVGLPAGTFASQIPTAKRIASASRAWNLGANGSAFDAADHVGAGGVSSTPGTASPVVGLSDSTNTSMNGAHGTGSALAISVAVGSPRASPVKVFSKWEKQELEARAMMKIREANKRKEMERDAKEREEREARERAEREKAERERMEREARERVERERAAKAEAERKAREEEEKRKAAASAAASANAAATTAAPGTGTTSSLTGAPPLGSQPTLSGAAPSSSTAAPASGGTGGFGFFPPDGAASSSGSTTAAAAASPFGAPKPPAATTTSTSTPGNPFGLPTGNGTTTESNKPASAFSFGPAPTSTTSATNGSTAPKANAFSFGPSEPKKEESSTASTTNGGASLLSRLGSTAPTTTSDPAKPASNPMFSFNTTAKQDGGASSSASSNPFGAPTSSSSSAGAGATSTPKFNFGFGGAKTTAAPSTSTTSISPTSGSTASSSLSGALGSDVAKTNPFGTFKTPGMLASGNGTAASGTTSGGATAPKFSFGGTGGGAGGSVFGGSSNNTSSSSSNVFGGSGSSNVFGGGGSANALSGGAGKEPVKSAFGNIGGGSGGSVFGSTSGMGAQVAASPSPFGAPSSSSQTQNVFGGGGATAGKEEPKKPLFSFNTGASSGSSATNTTTTPAAGGAGKFSFNFGGGGSSASTPAAGAAAASPFGAAPGGNGGSVFGGGAFGSAANQQK